MITGNMNLVLNLMGARARKIGVIWDLLKDIKAYQHISEPCSLWKYWITMLVFPTNILSFWKRHTCQIRIVSIGDVIKVLTFLPRFFWGPWKNHRVLRWQMGLLRYSIIFAFSGQWSLPGHKHLDYPFSLSSCLWKCQHMLLLLPQSSSLYKILHNLGSFNCIGTFS